MKKMIQNIKQSEWPIFVFVLILGITIAVGSANNGYSLTTSYLPAIGRICLEIILMYNSLEKRSNAALISIIALWLSTICITTYFSFRVNTVFQQYGLIGMAIIYACLSIWLIILYKNRKRTQPIT
jgi:hypothetical protein